MGKDRQIKVIFFTASTSGGGAEKILFNIIASLDNCHKSYLVITSKDDLPSNESVPVETYRLGFNNARKSFFKILQLIKTIKPQYVFTTSSSIGYMLALSKYFLKRDFKVIVRCAVPPTEIVRTSFKDVLLKYVIRFSYKKCDLLVAQTSFMKEDLVKSYHVSPQKVQVIRNIIDKSYLTRQASLFVPIEFDKEQFNVVASGALYSVKGFDLLIKAMAPIIRMDRKIHLWILGQERYEIGYKDYLQGLIEDCGERDNMTLLGYRDNPYPYYKNADLFVMSSRKEGFPNVVLESLYLRTPVVASDCVDFGEVIFEGINGYVIRKNNVEALKEGIEKALRTSFDMNKVELNNYDYNDLFS